MKALSNWVIFIYLGSQENHWLILWSFTHWTLGQTLLWGFPDHTLTDFTDKYANGCTWSKIVSQVNDSVFQAEHFFPAFSSSSVWNPNWKFSVEEKPICGPHDWTFYKKNKRILCLLLFWGVCFWNVAQILGRWTYSFILKRAKRWSVTSWLLSKTSCDSRSFDPSEAPLNAAVERGPEGLHPHMIKSELLVCLSSS